MKIYGNILNANILSKILSPGQTLNLGLKLSAGVLSVCAADGTDLSATNPGFVCAPSVTPGQNKVITITANATINDTNHATPQIKGSMGITQNKTWNNVMPGFLHLVNLDDTDANAKFALSRNPCAITTPASTNNIGYAGTAASTSSQTNFILFHSANTNYNSKPCVAVGSIRFACAVIGASEDAMRWTVDTIAQTDGIGKFQEQTQFVMPTNQNGADGGKTFNTSDGSTALSFSSVNDTYYRQHKNGDVTLYHTHEDQNSNGADASAVRWFGPLAANLPADTRCGGSGYGVIAGGASVISAYISSNVAYAVCFFCRAGDSGLLYDNAFSNTADYIKFSITYPAFSQ